MTKKLKAMLLAVTLASIPTLANAATENILYYVTHVDLPGVTLRR
jgi:hypothetical protein